jgi:aspartyl protease family protein
MAGALATLALPPPAAAQGVALGGLMGQKALLVIDGQPKMLAVGESAGGVTLVAAGDGQARVRIGGVERVLAVGGSPVAVGAGTAAGTGGNRSIVIPVGPGGHFLVDGSVRGRPLRFMVDTGATTVAISRADAERLAIDWRAGTPGVASTAGGPVPFTRVVLPQLRLAGVELALVEAVVLPTPMPYALLGNNVLARFQLRRDADAMRLDLK